MLYTPAVSDAARAELGIKPGDIPDEIIGVWPCCWKAYQVFRRMATQWNVGPGGPIGLKYESLQAVLAIMGVKAKDRQGVFSDIQDMELAALATIEAQRPKPT